MKRMKSQQNEGGVNFYIPELLENPPLELENPPLKPLELLLSSKTPAEKKSPVLIDIAWIPFLTKPHLLKNMMDTRMNKNLRYVSDTMSEEFNKKGVTVKTFIHLS